MPFIRFAFLFAMTSFTWHMGQHDHLDVFGRHFAMLFPLFAIALYLFPSIEALLNKSKHLHFIFVINLLLGWTLVGWVLALAQALDRILEPKEDEKSCHYCSERIKSVAVQCKHCGCKSSDGIEKAL